MHKSTSYSALSAVTTAGRQSLSIFTATKAMHAAVVGAVHAILLSTLVLSPDPDDKLDTPQKSCDDID